MRVTFFQKNNSNVVYVRYTYGKQQRYSTELKVSQNYWDDKRGSLHINAPNYRVVKAKLDKMHITIIECMSEKWEEEDIKQKVKAIANDREYQRNNMDMIQLGRILQVEKYEANNHPKHMQSAINLLERYKSENGLKSIPFSSIDWEFKDSFMRWMIKQDYSTNYISRVCQTIREIKASAIKRKYIKDNDFFNIKWKLKSFEPDSFVLTFDLLDKLRNLRLYGTQQKARDIFLLSCYTGCRISDVQRMNYAIIREHRGNKFLSFNTIKTDTPVVIPMLEELEKLYFEYNYAFPKPTSKYNSIIKEVFKLIFNDEKTRMRKSIGNKVIYVEEYTYSLVASHTARRTFATLFVQMGVPIAFVSKILGHSKIAQTEKYIKLDNVLKRQTAEEMMEIVSRSMSLN